MCKYCKTIKGTKIFNGKPLLDIEKVYTNIEQHLEGTFIEITIFGKDLTHGFIKINYCPICGRDLK